MTSSSFTALLATLDGRIEVDGEVIEWPGLEEEEGSDVDGGGDDEGAEDAPVEDAEE